MNVDECYNHCLFVASVHAVAADNGRTMLKFKKNVFFELFGFIGNYFYLYGISGGL
jgi:hypothetical protein